MKVIADDKIPFLKGVLEPFTDVEYLPSNKITRDIIKDCDALLIRTRTLCNAQLLEGTNIKFIGTATIGYDHIDTDFCNKAGITWKNAPGCNSGSVYQFVASVLVQLAKRNGFSLKDRSLGVVGVGHVGSKVVRLGELLGMHVYLCDPPRVRNENLCGFISLEGILRECDIISFHVPLKHTEPDKTFHMIDRNMLDHLNPGTILINTSRGEVADTDTVKEALRSGKLKDIVLDVWENEPTIDPELMQMAAIATPHIAGYSADGKANGTSMIVREFSNFFNLGIDAWETSEIPLPDKPEITIDCTGRKDEEIIASAILATYDVLKDDKRLRATPGDFEKQRGTYPLRREFHAFSLVLDNANYELVKKFRKLGFRVFEKTFKNLFL